MTLKEAALAYYDQGWRPIPLRWSGSAEDRKKPAIDAWRQYQEIPPAREVVEQWWDRMPEANIAILCGRISGLVVIDFDAGENHGIDPIEFILANRLPRNAGVVQTGKGWHLYFKHPGGVIPNGVRIGRLGNVPMDVRGDGGYVVAPPSMHGNGWQYAWLQQPPVAELPVLPDDLRMAMNASPDVERVQTNLPSYSSVTRVASEVDQILAPAKQGTRNHSAARVAGYLLQVTKGDAKAAWPILKAWNMSNKPPLGLDELAHTFDSIARADESRRLDEMIESQADNGLLSGAAWADAVRDAPPRHGVQAPSLPGLEETGGFVERDFVIIAGRPGTGKSTLAWGIVLDVALMQRVPTLIFSTEMTATDVARWMSSRMHQEVVEKLPRELWLDTLHLISKSPVTICDKGSINIDYIERVIDTRPETKIVIIDHIQRIQSGKGGQENRNRDLELMATRLKNLAKDRKLTMIVLSQMNRAAQTGRPTLAALRDSGGLEQEADVVFFIWSDYDDPTMNPLPVKIYLAKNRFGALREVECNFIKHLHTFKATDSLQALKQHALEAKARRTLNAILRGEDGRVDIVPDERTDEQVEGDTAEAAALRLLD